MTNPTEPKETKRPDIKIRAAALATGMNILLTGLKFLLFFFSGSLAILAEACHSFTDIATSFLVLISAKRSRKKTSEKETTGSDGGDVGANSPKVDKQELGTALAIGIFLLILATMLLANFIQAEPMQVENSLFSGLMFLIFSVGSYFIYRFEMHIGKQEKSISLVADGQHAKADMTASLLTGFSLILYAIDVNIDRWIAGLIALFILSFAVETIINVALVYFRRESAVLYKYQTFKIITFLGDKTSIQNTVKALRSFLESKSGNTRLVKSVYRTVIFLPAVVLCLGYFSTAFFSVEINEQAIVERFGKPVNLNQSTGPGLHVKCPWPVDRVIKVRSAYIKKLNIGNTTDKQNRGLLWTRSHGTEEAFLSGDNNFFYPYIVLHYRIKNISHYLYMSTDTEVLIHEVAHRVATALFAREAFYSIATTHRKSLEQTFSKTLQGELDRLQSGIELLAANFKDIHPPISVADSFERVIAGYQEKQKIINDARGYRNTILPETRGTAASRLESAQAYITDRIEKARGKAARFNLSVPTSPAQKDLTMYRIYLQTISTVLGDKANIVVDPKVGIPEVWMDFENIFPSGRNGGPQQ